MTFFNRVNSAYLSAFLFLVFLFLTLFTPVQDIDVWFNLKSGIEILNQQTIFSADPFSFTSPEAEWVNRLWLFQIILAGIFGNFSWVGLVLFKALVFIAIFSLILVPHLKKKSFSLVLILSIMAVAGLEYRMLVRPEILSFLFLPITFFALEQILIKEKSIALFLLPFTFLLWVNSHAFFVLGVLIVFAFLAEYIFQSKWGQSSGVILWVLLVGTNK